MPRKPLIYTHEFPYHVRARSNNREWFYLPIDVMWDVFVRELNKLVIDYDLRIHVFVLMDNHYHLIVSTSAMYLLGEVMQNLQRSVSRRVNGLAGRINHVFGGPYTGSLITNEYYYSQAVKYVYRNPIKAAICSRVEDYKYSTLNSHKFPDLGKILVVAPSSGIDSLIPATIDTQLIWLNEGHSEDQEIILQKALRKTLFKITGRDLKLFK